MLAKLSDFKKMLSDYTNYLSLHADDKTPAKLAIIQDLSDELNNKFLPPCSVHDKKICHARAGGQPFLI
jgi:hypothetical protein